MIAAVYDFAEIMKNIEDILNERQLIEAGLINERPIFFSRLRTLTSQDVIDILVASGFDIKRKGKYFSVKLAPKDRNKFFGEVYTFDVVIKNLETFLDIAHRTIKPFDYIKAWEFADIKEFLEKIGFRIECTDGSHKLFTAEKEANDGKTSVFSRSQEEEYCIFCGTRLEPIGQSLLANCNAEDYGLHPGLKDKACCALCDRLITQTNRELAYCIRDAHRGGKIRYGVEKAIKNLQKVLDAIDDSER